MSAELSRVEEVLLDAARTGDSVVDPPVQHVLGRRGKRLRPSLVLLAADDGGSPSSITAAAAVELIHVASLHHDDVMDGSDRRRGAPSAHAAWGSTISVLSGAHLFASAGRLVARLGNAAVAATGAAVAALQRGQARETEQSFNLDVLADDHIETLALKTASLFDLAVTLGALVHPDREVRVPALRLYAHHLGVAFQLADDLLDLRGDGGTLGKDPWDDLDAGVYSLPVLLAAQAPAIGPEVRALLALEVLTDPEKREVCALIARSGAFEVAGELAREHSRRAVASLEVLPDTSPRHALASLADFAVRRAS